MGYKAVNTVGNASGNNNSEHLLNTIERITGNGDTAEVKKQKDGTYKVYAVKKKVEMA